MACNWKSCDKKDLFYNAETLCEEVGTYYYSMHKKITSQEKGYNFILIVFKPNAAPSETMFFLHKNEVHFVCLFQKLCWLQHF
jgi:hypothetical protein